MAIFSQTRHPLSGALDILRRQAAERTSATTLAAEHERKSQLSARFTLGMPINRHPLLERLRQNPQFTPRVETLRKQTAPTSVQVSRMTALLKTIDYARSKGIPLAKALNKR